MTWPRLERRICRQCARRKCRKAGHVFCGVPCYRASRRKPRPLCAVCRLRPACRGGETCGRSCGRRLAVRRTPVSAVKMVEGRRVALRRRLAEYLREEVTALATTMTPVECGKVLARIYRLGYKRGSSAAYWRYANIDRQVAS